VSRPGVELRVLEDPGVEAAERLAAAVRAGEEIALTGGDTPRAAYERLATFDLDWSRCRLWFGDERCVGPDDPRSNYGMARAALFDRLEEQAEVVRMEGERGPEAGAAAYEQDLRRAFGENIPRLDLVLLGIGPDAHCASLFPNQPALFERERLAVGVEQAGLEPFVPRVTLTLPVLNAAIAVVFLAAGAEKADAVARAFEGEPDPSAPSSLIAPASGSLTVLLDAEAANGLGAEA
jgi:6-phosphogluconolactonase